MRCEHGDAAKRNIKGQCLTCRNLRAKAYRTANPKRYRKYRIKAEQLDPGRAAAALRKFYGTEKGMLCKARARAKRGAYLCTITVKDIVVPERCPLLGIKLARGVGTATPASPSLDKIKPHLGYVPGNVWVISHRANSIKNNASLEDLKNIVANWSALLTQISKRR